MKKTRWFMLIISCMTISASPAAVITFTGASGDDNNFSTAANWNRTSVSGKADQAYIGASATSANNPAFVDFTDDSPINVARIYSSAGFGAGMSYVEIRPGKTLKAGFVFVGDNKSAEYNGTLVLRSGGALQTAANNNGRLRIGGEDAGMIGNMVVEARATFNHSYLVLAAQGTLSFIFDANSVSTFSAKKTTTGSANYLNGMLKVDLEALAVSGSYTLIDSNSGNLLIAGNLKTALVENGGAISGTGDYTSTHFTVLNGGTKTWILTTADGGRNLVLTVSGLPGVASKLMDSKGQIDEVPEWHAVFSEYPLHQIKAQGWLGEWLSIQKNGITGHLEDIKGLTFEKIRWGTDSMFLPTEKSLFDWTVPAHWHDAWIRFAYLYGDPAFLQKVKARYDWTLAHPDKDGFLGPRHINVNAIRPQALFFRGLMAYYAETHDPQILTRLVAHYVACRQRAGNNQFISDPTQGGVDIEILTWLYHQTGDRRMLGLALELARNHKLLDRVTEMNTMPLDQTRLYTQYGKMHGVVFMENMMNLAQLYMATGDTKYLTAVENSFQVVDEKYMLVDGCPSAREQLYSNKSWETHETCVINNTSWTCGYMLQATGEARWADRIERVCLNAGLGAVTKDFKQLQYFSGPNQVIAQRPEKYGKHLSRLCSMFDNTMNSWCCAANINKIIPNYIGRMWLKGSDGSVVAALYGSSTLSVKAGADETPVSFIQRTEFPFSEDVEFEIQTEKPASFSFWMRIPGWCDGAEVSLNGEKLEIETKAATFVKLNREFQSGDKISLHLPMQIKATQWPNGGVAIERGPLVYSLRVEAERHPKETGALGKEFPLLEMTPKSPWNYALDIDPGNAAKKIKILREPKTTHPWDDASHAPIALEVPVRRVVNWSLTNEPKPDRPEKLKPGQLLTPDLPEPETMELGISETITLVPLGSTTLRLTVFPTVN